MENCNISNINRIASYLKVPAGKVGVNNEKVVCRTVKNKVLSGFGTIIVQLARESKENGFADKDLVTQCSIIQWIDYAVLFIESAHNIKTTIDVLLQELDYYLADRSYLVGQNLSLADVVVFYSLHNVINALPASSKEKFINVSRWYDHIQQNRQIRQNLPLINFTNIYLHIWATGKHI